MYCVSGGGDELPPKPKSLPTTDASGNKLRKPPRIPELVDDLPDPLVDDAVGLIAASSARAICSDD
jgi:hypothetical protein